MATPQNDDVSELIAQSNEMTTGEMERVLWIGSVLLDYALGTAISLSFTHVSGEDGAMRSVDDPWSNKTLEAQVKRANKLCDGFRARFGQPLPGEGMAPEKLDDSAVGKAP